MQMIILGVLGLSFLIAFIVIYNDLAKKRILVHEGWSGIGTFLQQRLDLVQNLVETVQGYAGHENKTLTDVIKARNESITALTPEAQIEAARHMNAALINFKALSEEYPNLKADQSFLKLQDQLQAMEDKINQSRRYYNGTVRVYNQALAVFPKNIIAGIFSFTASPFFLEDAEAKTAPKVKFPA